VQECVVRAAIIGSRPATRPARRCRRRAPGSTTDQANQYYTSCSRASSAAGSRSCGPGRPVLRYLGLLPHETQTQAPGATRRGGWGHMHQQRRRQLEPLVRAGAINCARCGRRIEPHQAWAIDHHDDRRLGYLGPSHATCNAIAAANKANRNRHGLPVTHRVATIDRRPRTRNRRPPGQPAGRLLRRSPMANRQPTRPRTLTATRCPGSLRIRPG
jgi:hypothetical protein